MSPLYNPETMAVINFATVSCGKPLMVRIEVKNALYAALSTVNLKIRYVPIFERQYYA